MKPHLHKKRVLTLISLIFLYIVTILYFIYSAYISIASLTANVYVGEELLNSSRSAVSLFLSFTYEYLVFRVIMVLNYFLYKKRHKLPLLIINIIIFVILTIDLTGAVFYHEQPIDLLLFVISSIYGFIYSYLLSKKSLKE